MRASTPRPIARAALLLVVFATLECASPAPARLPENTPPPSHTSDDADAAPAVEPRDADALARAVLSRELGDGTLPDIGLLPKRGTVFVRSRGAPLSARAFAVVGQRVLRPAALPELQQLADRTNKTVSFVILSIDIDGDTAVVYSGVDIVLPASSKGVKLCCCEHSTTWRRRAGGWERDTNALEAKICS